MGAGTAWSPVSGQGRARLLYKWRGSTGHAEENGSQQKAPSASRSHVQVTGLTLSSGHRLDWPPGGAVRLRNWLSARTPGLERLRSVGETYSLSNLLEAGRLPL